nr:MAG TPA: hypothetical protein [Caudoviricetes sp.]
MKLQSMRYRIRGKYVKQKPCITTSQVSKCGT